MEPENFETQPEEIKSSFHKVTPLSKYLALALLVILPFFGGWVGYTFAPEKVVEVEKIMEVEKTAITDEDVTSPQNLEEEYEYILRYRDAAPDTFTERHPAKYSIVVEGDDPTSLLVENVETLIPEDYRGEYSSVLGLTQLSNHVVLLQYAPYLEGNRYLFRLDAETLEITNLGSFRDTTLSGDKNLLAVTSDDHSKIRFIETLTGAEVAILQSDSNGVAFGACEIGCYIFGRWIDDGLFLFDSVRIASNFPEVGSITYLESHIFDGQNNQIRQPTEAEQQQFLTLVDATWR